MHFHVVLSERDHFERRILFEAHAVASEFFDDLATTCRAQLDTVETGRFGADMQVSLTNDGPVTFWLSTR